MNTDSYPSVYSAATPHPHHCHLDYPSIHHPSMSLQPLWTLATFSVSCSHTQSVGLLGWGMSPLQSRYVHVEQHKYRINAHRHQCLEWYWNPRSQCSSGRRRSMACTAQPLRSAVTLWLSSSLQTLSPSLFRHQFVIDVDGAKE
jgi:hypothetical protein